MAETVVQWWLAELDKLGNPRLCDGPHLEMAAVEKALYLYRRMGLRDGDAKTYGAVRLEVFDVTPKAHGANEDAIATLKHPAIR